MRDYQAVRNRILRGYRRFAPVVWAVPTATLVGAVLITAGLPRPPILATVLLIGLVSGGVAVWAVALSRYAPALEILDAWNTAAKTYWRSEVGPGRRPRNRREARAWLEAHPETPANWCVRIGLLLLLGRIDEVRAAVLRGPTETPIDRFDHVYFGALTDWMETGTADVAALRSAADGLDTDHAVTGVLGVADVESRLALESGGDIWAPLIAARARIQHIPRGASRWLTAARFGGAIGVMTAIAVIVLGVVVRPAT